jgi:uncharacterized protein (DUF488 family)
VRTLAGLFTIGYSSFTIDNFITILKRYNIQVVVDVRSQPYSATYPYYNKDNIESLLNRNKIYYRNYSKEFGARQTDKRYFSAEGYLDFELFTEAPDFKQGYNKLNNSIVKGYTIALMCAEKDPAKCHRSIMVSRAFYSRGHKISHILTDGGIENQNDIETQLLDKYYPDRKQGNLFGEQSQDSLTVLAYKKRNAEIGYRLEGSNYESAHDGVY